MTRTDENVSISQGPGVPPSALPVTLTLRFSAGHALVAPPTSQLELAGLGVQRLWDMASTGNLEINCVVFHDPAKRPCALVAVDFLYANELARRLTPACNALGIDVVVLASHTHFAPSLCPELPPLGATEETFVSMVCDQAHRLISDLADEAASANEPIEMRGSAPLTSWTVSRRRRPGLELDKEQRFGLKWGIAMQPSSGSPVQAPISVWTGGRAGATEFVLWSFACHPTGHPGQDEIDADFPGAVREAIRERYGRDVSVIYMQGASGDLRPPFTTFDPRQVGLRDWLVAAVPIPRPMYRKATRHEFEHWCQGLAGQVVESLQQLDATETYRPSHLGLASCEEDISSIITGDHFVDHVQVGALTLSPGPHILFINAEVTSSLGALLLKKHSEWSIATCANESLGYLATRDEVREGGYEGRTWVRHFGGSGAVRATAQDCVARLSTTAAAAATEPADPKP